MTGQTLPPVRTTHVWRAPNGLWCYDSWGRHGRPILLIPAVLFDRVMWWPAAADLRPHATVVAVDLPGHGVSTRRRDYDPEELVDDLAHLLSHDLGVHQAPIVVGHASSAPLAVLFAARHPTHAVVAVDPPGRSRCEPDLAEYLDRMNLDALPAPYGDMVVPVGDPRLLAEYADCIRLQEPSPIGPGTAGRPALLAVHSQAPPATRPAPGAPAEPWSRVFYDVPGCFPHLADVSRFVDDVRALL